MLVTLRHCWSHIVSCSVAISVFSLGGWRKGRGGCVRNIGHDHDFCKAQKAENTDPCPNYAVKYATARGPLRPLALVGHKIPLNSANSVH